MEIFKTKDLNLATYLKFKGHKILNCETEGSKITFCFEDDGEIEKDTFGYYNDDGGYQSYMNAWKELKSLLYTVSKK